MSAAKEKTTPVDALKIGSGVLGTLGGVILIVILLAVALKYTLVEPSVAGGLTDQQRFDLLTKAQAENERLTTTYGWTDKSKGIVRIPVDLAMRKLIEERKQ
jgi:hypothetical protein